MRTELSVIELKILQMCHKQDTSMSELLKNLGYKTKPGGIKKTMKKLLELELIAYTLPDVPRSKRQQYKITHLGKMLIMHEPTNGT